MPEKIDKYKILVASPSDVRDEREALDEVIAELNNTYGSRNNVILELIKWETHSAPAASKTHVQDQIDIDLGIDYDLFVGIIWKKFGTPTDKYASGTEQEFRNAHEKFKQDSKSVQILFYFKTAAPTSLVDVDPIQLTLVNQFKNEIGEKNIYYWEFITNEELQKFLRIHIPKRIDELRKSQKPDDLTVIEHEGIINNDKINTEEEELGIIDYQEIYEDSFADSTEALSRIGEAIEWIGIEINKKAAELTSLSKGKQEIRKKVLRDFYRRTAKQMNDFASRMEPDIPIFFSSFENGTDALSNMVSLYRSDFSDTYEKEVNDAIEMIINLGSSIEEALSSMESFLNSVSKLPRIAKELNQARRNLETKLKELINKLEISYSITDELKKNLKEE